MGYIKCTACIYQIYYFTVIFSQWDLDHSGSCVDFINLSKT